jgi:hypothetical protein
MREAPRRPAAIDRATSVRLSTRATLHASTPSLGAWLRATGTDQKLAELISQKPIRFAWNEFVGRLRSHTKQHLTSEGPLPTVCEISHNTVFVACVKRDGSARRNQRRELALRHSCLAAQTVPRRALPSSPVCTLDFVALLKERKMNAFPLFQFDAKCVPISVHVSTTRGVGCAAHAKSQSKEDRPLKFAIYIRNCVHRVDHESIGG